MSDKWEKIAIERSLNTVTGKGSEKDASPKLRASGSALAPTPVEYGYGSSVVPSSVRPEHDDEEDDDKFPSVSWTTIWAAKVRPHAIKIARDNPNLSSPRIAKKLEAYIITKSREGDRSLCLRNGKIPSAAYILRHALKGIRSAAGVK